MWASAQQQEVCACLQFGCSRTTLSVSIANLVLSSISCCSRCRGGDLASSSRAVSVCAEVWPALHTIDIPLAIAAGFLGGAVMWEHLSVQRAGPKNDPGTVRLGHPISQRIVSVSGSHRIWSQDRFGRRITRLILRIKTVPGPRNGPGTVKLGCSADTVRTKVVPRLRLTTCSTSHNRRERSPAAPGPSATAGRRREPPGPPCS